MTGVIAKPQMRGLLASWTKKNVSALLVGSTLIGVAYYYFVGVRRKKAYAEFYKNYDDAKAFEEMKKLGIFRSVNCKGEINTEFFE